MKNRLHDKKAGIAILAVLIFISLAEVIYRAVVVGEAVLATHNLGEQISVMALAAIILIFTAKGKDRLCYICTGAWIGYFVLDQFFELPGFLATIVSQVPPAEEMNFFSIASPVAHILSMCGIIAIGVFLVEYMNDGTICNRAFNSICIITVLSILVTITGNIFIILTTPMMEELHTGVALVVQFRPEELVLAAFHNLYRLTMIFLFTFFAYDSAKHQLKKANLSK